MDTRFDAELIRRYDRPGPRYTSYPTAPQFHAGFTAADYAATVAALRANRRDATSQSYKATVTRLIARLESAATN